MYRKKTSEYVFSIFNTIFMLLLIIVCVYPLLYVLFASFSLDSKLMAYQGPLLRPLGFSLSAYRAVLENKRILSGYVNTIVIVVCGTGLNLALSSLGAFFLSRHNIMLRRPIMLMILFTMYFSGGLIPYYFTVKGLGMDNTLFSVIIPGAINTYNLIILRTGFEAIPVSLEESARLDGANDFVILFRIILPLALPTVAVVALYYCVGHWNAWFYASIFIRDRMKQPLQLVLREILVANDTNSMTTWSQTGSEESLGETIKYATTIVATVPILCVYPFVQKYFVKGVMIGAVKE